MHVLFINTGVQLVCEPLKSRVKAALGLGWQRCEFLGSDGKLQTFHYVQWQLLGDRLVFAVDTTCGEERKGFFRHAVSGDFIIQLVQLVDRDKKVIPNLPKVEIKLIPATAGGGAAKQVDLVVDFGNSRTGALLVEQQAERRMPQMIPFELANRFLLDLWDSSGRYKRKWSARWFSSRSQWCQSPYLPPPELKKKVYREETVAGLWGTRTVVVEEEVEMTPRLFQDLSCIRMGQEGDDVTQSIRVDADARTGLSSPKRYLWAADASWLGGALWSMADPTDRAGTRAYSEPLQGPFFRFLAEADPDELQLPPPGSDEISDDEESRESPQRPRHAPRSMMVAALYEILCQAYVYVNSPAYRELAGDLARQRDLRSLVLTFPSGMIPQERERFQKQAQKALDIFHATLGRAQPTPALMMQIDEASAVHLTYIWSELQMLERNAALWFSLMGHVRGEETPAGPAPEVRIGCIDIGGGTSDLMIAGYTLRSELLLPTISGTMLHRDGISVAGDQLLKRLLERIIIPRLAECTGMSGDVVEFLFGLEVLANAQYRSQRVQWMNRMFVPLAQAYLLVAVNLDSKTVLSHTDPGYVPSEFVEMMQQVIDKEFGGGKVNLSQDLKLKFDQAVFDDIVHEVFNDLLVDFCQRLVDYDVDVVLLAGQPTKLGPIQELVKQYLPLHSSRVIPIHNHYAGNWYPYQDDAGRDPGLIVDPKSAVVVGGAINFLLAEGLLGNLQFNRSGLETRDPTHDNDYYWGLLTEGTSKIQAQQVLFRPPPPDQRAQRVERKEFKVVAERVLIGRRLSANEQAEASPVWCIKLDKRGRPGPIDVRITLERRRAAGDDPETFEIFDVKGTVAGMEACADGSPEANVALSWRTLTTDAFYLDTGALDNIQLKPRR